MRTVPAVWCFFWRDGKVLAPILSTIGTTRASAWTQAMSRFRPHATSREAAIRWLKRRGGAVHRTRLEVA